MDTKKTEDRLNYYLTFDYLPSSRKAELAIEKLFDELSLGKGKQRNLTEDNSNKKYHSFSLFLSTLLAKTRLTQTKHCYRSMMRDKFTGEPVSYRHFQSFKAALLKHGFIYHQKGKFHEDEEAHFFRTEEEKKHGKKKYIYYSAAKFFVSEKLLGFCNDNGITELNVLKHFIQRRPDTFIEARYPGTKSRKVNYKGRKARRADVYKLAEAQAQQAIMREVNDFLFAQKLSGCVFNGLKRVYNDYVDDGSYGFDMGGRLYACGENNYQRMKKEERAKLKINGERVCEVDIHASFLTILHGIMNKRMPNRANLYSVTNLPRMVVKSWINNSITMGHPISRWPKDTMEEFAKEMPDYKYPTAPKAGEQILKHYAFLDDLEAAGLDWRRLHNIEGGMMLEAVRKLSRLGIAAYPIHDSLLVARRHKNVAHNILSDCFHDAAGLSPTLK